MANVAKPEDEYDPYKERKLEKPTNDLESMVHIIKGILGTGILAMPEAFKNSGILLGFAICIGNGTLVTYGIHIFVNCMHMLCKRNRMPVITYTQAMRIGFEQGPPWAQKISGAAGKLADGFIVFYQLGACCVYILFVVVNVKAVCDEFLRDQISLQVYLIALIIPFLFINSLRNLKILVPFSFFANAITFLTIGVVFYYIFATPLPPLSDRPIFADLRRFPLSFGITNFAFQAVAVVIAVENNMKNPGSFSGCCGIYNKSIYILMVLYVTLGFFGFWKFGDETQASITLNFPPSATLTQVVNLLFALAIYISFGLNGFIPIQLLWDTYLSKHLENSNWKLAWEYMLRIAVVTVSFFFAASIPMLGLFMSVFGAISLSHMGFFFPALLDLCVRHPSNYGRGGFYKWRDILFITYGFIGLIAGCGVGIREIVLEFMKKK